jgi:hypothetical protein
VNLKTDACRPESGLVISCAGADAIDGVSVQFNGDGNVGPFAAGTRSAADGLSLRPPDTGLPPTIP